MMATYASGIGREGIRGTRPEAEFRAGNDCNPGDEERRTRLQGEFAHGIGCKGSRFRIDLQWFASAEDEGRTEEASEYKIKKAREEGRVAKSQDLVQAVGLMIPAALLFLMAPSMLDTMVQMVNFYLRMSTEAGPGDWGAAGRAFIDYLLRLCLPVALVAVVAAIGSNLLQVGFLFTTKPLAPDFSRVVPKLGKFFKRTLFSAEGLFNIAKTIAKIAAIGLIAYLNITGDLPFMMKTLTMPFLESLQHISQLVARIVLESAAVMLVLAVPDWFFQRRQYKESLKMSKQEVKEERKMYEGDPLVKSRLRERMRELLTKNMVRNVPKADVVVTNPTHFSVALEWNRSTMAAPTVTAKGVDEVALRIREIARGAGVPLVENRPLARALYAETEIGDTIPEKYYQAVATVLAYVYKLDERKSGGQNKASNGAV